MASLTGTLPSPRSSESPADKTLTVLFTRHERKILHWRMELPPCQRGWYIPYKLQISTTDRWFNGSRETVHEKKHNRHDTTYRRNFRLLHFYKTKSVSNERNSFWWIKIWFIGDFSPLCIVFPVTPSLLPHLLPLRVLSPFLFSPISVPFNHFTVREYPRVICITGVNRKHRLLTPIR